MSTSSETLNRPSPEQVWDWLSHLTDPEIPVVTLKEMGILRQVEVDGDLVVVTITPTYSGCPAMSQIEDDVRQALTQRGLQVEVVTQLSPAWSTDWMDAITHRKLREYGIAPPTGAAPVSVHAAVRLVPRLGQSGSVPCPHCGSNETTETSYFGSTACKALYKCLSCLEPFDYFKPH